MSARIAPEPISATITAGTEYRPRTTTGESPAVPPPAKGPAGKPSDSRFADILPPMPPPPDPPGTMFAAAVMAGALSPRPQSPEEVFLRLGSAWSPPESGYRLADRRI